VKKALSRSGGGGGGGGKSFYLDEMLQFRWMGGMGRWAGTGLAFMRSARLCDGGTTWVLHAEILAYDRVRWLCCGTGAAFGSFAARSTVCNAAIVGRVLGICVRNSRDAGARVDRAADVFASCGWAVHVACQKQIASHRADNDTFFWDGVDLHRVGCRGFPVVTPRL